MLLEKISWTKTTAKSPQMEKQKRSRDKNSQSLLTESTSYFQEIFSVITAVS
ncbi:MAG: hypothetical protein ACKO2T_25315 [Microcystis aeruginosa]